MDMDTMMVEGSRDRGFYTHPTVQGVWVLVPAVVELCVCAYKYICVCVCWLVQVFCPVLGIHVLFKLVSLQSLDFNVSCAGIHHKELCQLQGVTTDLYSNCISYISYISYTSYISYIYYSSYISYIYMYAIITWLPGQNCSRAASA